ncbi:hypothetical protein [Nocardia nova]|uniref:hypothetical protein n=1 Tax=Nocardia nova TaxID=37330 RepID=UPI0011B0D509|nr:hypothetical protein [Nocardia nova]
MEFAAEAAVLDDKFMMSNTFDSDLMDRINQRVAPAYGVSEAAWQGTRTKRLGTGGTLLRVVDVATSTEGVRVTMCTFNSPGLYDVVDGKPVGDPRNPRTISAQISTVAQTTQPAAVDKKKSMPNPRPLVVSIVDAVEYNESPDVLCDKFAPDPFVQTPPSPLPPTAAHK